MGDNTKIGHAIQNAALECINEDIHEINSNINNIHNSFESLKKALDAFPITFDGVCSGKISVILDVLKEVDDHTNKLNATIKANNDENALVFAEKYADNFNRKIRGYKVISVYELVKVSGISSMFGAVVGGLISAVLVWVAFPSVF